MSNAILDNVYKLLDYGNNRSLVNAGCLCDLTRYSALVLFPVLL